MTTLEPKKPVRIVIIDDNEPEPAKVINIPKEKWDRSKVIDLTEKKPNVVSHTAKEVTSTIATGGKAAATGLRRLFGGTIGAAKTLVHTAKEAIHDGAAEYDQRKEAKKQKEAVKKELEKQVDDVFAGKAPEEVVSCSAEKLHES